MLVQTSTKRALERLCCYSGLLWEHPRGCGGTAEYYRSSLKSLLVHKSTNGALMEHSGGCAGTAAHYRSTGEAVLVQQTTIGALEYPK